jgi:hypothetical protein
MLVGRDGSAVTLQGTEEAVVPIGDYQVQSFTVTLSDPRGGPRWTFEFSDSAGRRKAWYTVPKDGSVTIDPVGKLDFRTGLKEGTEAAPGKDLSFQPELYTGDGLLIVRCVRGMPGEADRETCFAETVLANGGDRLAAARSGFQ